MMMTSFAIMDLDVRRRLLISRIVALFRRKDREPTLDISWDHLSGNLPIAPPLASFMSDPGASDLTVDYRWRRHPQLLQDAAAPGLTAEERLARKQAVRGLYLAHNGDSVIAGSAFRQALEACEIDLTELPTFWQMPRSGILAAAEALETAGRYREASTIQARLRSEFKPRTVLPLRPPGRIATPIRAATAD